MIGSISAAVSAALFGFALEPPLCSLRTLNAAVREAATTRGRRSFTGCVEVFGDRRGDQLLELGDPGSQVAAERLVALYAKPQLLVELALLDLLQTRG